MSYISGFRFFFCISTALSRAFSGNKKREQEENADAAAQEDIPVRIKKKTDEKQG